MRIASDLEGTLKSLCDAKSEYVHMNHMLPKSSFPCILTIKTSHSLFFLLSPTCVKMQTGSFIDKPFNRVNQGLRVYPFWPGLGYEDGKFHPFLKVCL